MDRGQDSNNKSATSKTIEQNSAQTDRKSGEIHGARPSETKTEDLKHADSTTTTTFHTTTSSSQKSEEPSESIRDLLGRGTIAFSEIVNDYLAEARILGVTTIGLVAAYGIFQSPLFFRYRTVSELPSSWFRRRKFIHGRLVRVWVDQHNQQKKKILRRSTERNQAIQNGQQVQRWNRVSPKTLFQPHDEDDGGKYKNFMDTADSEPEREFDLLPIHCQIRHSSPMESLLSQVWYERFMKWHPFSSTGGTRLDQVDEQLMVVEIAGVRSMALEHTPLRSPSQSAHNNSLLASLSPEMIYQADDMNSHTPEMHQSNYRNATTASNLSGLTNVEWLESLAKERMFVSCQLLGRREVVAAHVPSSSTSRPSHKRKIPGLEILENSGEDALNRTDRQSNNSSSSTSDASSQVAVGRLYYRSPTSLFDQMRQLFFPTDVALSLVEMGRACVIGDEETLVSSSLSYRVVDTTDSVRDLRRDVAYVERLHRAQNEAVAHSRGIWQNPLIRNVCADIVKEVEFQTKGRWWQKLWRWVRGG